MFTVIVRAYSGPEALGVSLRAAFPGVVSGLIADAVVVAPPGASDCADLAEAAGALLAVESNFVEGFRAACRLARQEAVLLIDGGISFDDGMLESFVQKSRQATQHVCATLPVQMGIRGVLQQLLGRVTRDQVLLMPRDHGLRLMRDPWELRYGRALQTVPFRTERPKP
jgi:hypothetical protein